MQAENSIIVPTLNVNLEDQTVVSHTITSLLGQIKGVVTASQKNPPHNANPQLKAEIEFCQETWRLFESKYQTKMGIKEPALT